MNNDMYRRLAITEGQEALRRSQTMEFLQEKYQIACDEQNEEDAAMFARKIRNKLLVELKDLGYFSGKYHITQTRHFIDRTAGYGTSLEVKSC